MAALPSPTQVAGTHSAIYEAYLHQVDPNGTGAVQALDAARFLKKSRLSDVVLSKIWDLSDPTGKGYLDRAGLFVALKLVALAQAGKDINMTNIHSETPPPKVGELPKVPPPSRPAAPVLAHTDWTMKPSERDKYSQLFDSLQPHNGLIAGNKVKGVLMESKLPLETLGKIWDLADQDKDGMLDRHEFLVAMHLVYKALEKHAVPTTLPPELRAHPAPPPRPPSRPPSRPASPQPRHAPPPRPAAMMSHPPPQSNASLLEGLLDLSSPTQTAPSLMSSSLMTSSAAPTSSAPAASPAGSWVVNAAEKAHFDSMFTAADADRDGLVSGLEIKQTLMESGLPQHTLAHIWALCDSESVGKLTRDQFALAMWLVKRAQQGQAPPATLTPAMVPPSCRKNPPQAHSVTMMQPEPVSLGPQPTPELEAIAREVDALARERVTLETELAARERELALQSSEANSLQSELDTLSATLKQLENQKGEANKRLGDLKSQVDKLRSQVSAQEAAAAETEAEVAARRAAAQTIKEKERALQEDVRSAEAEAETLNGHLRRTVLAVSQATIKIAHLEEQLNTLTLAAEALASTTSTASHEQLNLQPQFSREHLARLVRGATPNDALEDESFESRNEFGNMNGSGFGSDPFKDGAFPAAQVQPNDPFAPSSGQQDGFDSDPFSKAFPTNNADPFAGDAFTTQDNTAKTNDAGWAEDPFAVLHAPTRDASPTPVLPPKKHKTPPPRPAPPRPAPLNKTDKTAMEFTEDPFKDYRYEDPFNIDDPFADVTDSRRHDPFNRPTSVAGFETDDFFSNSNKTVNGSFPPKPSGRVSAPPLAFDPFNKSEFKPTLPPISTNNNDSWAAWPNDNWAADDAWAKPTNQKSVSNVSSSSDAWSSSNSKSTADAWKSDNWGNKSDNWATDWGSTNTDQNKNLNETWPSNTLPNKKEKSPKPVKYARSLVHTIGGIARTRHGKEKKDKSKVTNLEARSSDLPTEEQQWAWAAAESKRLEAEAEARRRQEDAELQLALAISRQEK